MKNTQNILTQKEFRQFMVDGYFIFRNLLSSKQIEAIHERLSEMVNIASGKSSNQVVNTATFSYDGRRGDQKQITNEAGIRKLMNFAHQDPVIWENLCLNENVQTLYRTLLGDDVALLFDSAFTKPPKVGEPTPWHQDIGLWTDAFPSLFGNLSTVLDALNIWVGVTRCDIENGCLQVVPGSHHTEIIKHIQYPGVVHAELPRELLEGQKPVHIELNPGDALVWNSLLWHYSPRNESDKKRWGIAQVSVRTEAARKIFSLPGDAHGRKVRHLVQSGKPVSFENIFSDETVPLSLAETR